MAEAAGCTVAEAGVGAVVAAGEEACSELVVSAVSGVEALMELDRAVFEL